MGCFVILVMLLVGTIVRGLVLSQFWAWFIVPLGVMPITVPWALGISSLVWFLTDHASSQESDTKDIGDLAVNLSANALLIPLLALAFGWFYHSWM